MMSEQKEVSISDIFSICADTDGFLFMPEPIFHSNATNFILDNELLDGSRISWEKTLNLEKEFRNEENPEGNIAYTINEITHLIPTERSILLNFISRNYKHSDLNEPTWEKFSRPLHELSKYDLSKKQHTPTGKAHLRILSQTLFSMKYRETILQVCCRYYKKRKITRGKNKGKFVTVMKPLNLGWHIVRK
jgi:hypothetical protein